MKHSIVLMIIGILLFTALPVAAQNRTVLCELFTSTTCPPCVGANQGFDTWLSSYANKNRVAVIKYHVWWPSPGNDPYYLANKTQVTTRNTYYGNNYAPHMFIDGTDAGSSYSGWGAAVDARLSSVPAITISISGTVNKNDANVSIKLFSGTTAIPAGTLKLHVSLIESGLMYTGTNGDPKHDGVMRQMVSDANGETFTMSTQETKSFTRTFTLDSAWNKTNCTLVAFVQVQETRAIVQAGVKNVIDLVSGIQKESNLPEGFSLEQNYPNPFNPTTVISYQLPVVSNVSLKIFDLLGRDIATLVNEEQSAGRKHVQWNAGNAASGIYFYKIQAGRFNETKRMILMK